MYKKKKIISSLRYKGQVIVDSLEVPADASVLLPPEGRRADGGGGGGGGAVVEDGAGSGGGGGGGACTDCGGTSVVGTA